MCGFVIEIVDEGLLGCILEYLKIYIDYDVIVCDLEMDYVEMVIVGEIYIYCVD